MDIAHAETASQFPGILPSNASNGNLREVDLNETPLMRNMRLHSKMKNLSKTGMCKLLNTPTFDPELCIIDVPFHFGMYIYICMYRRPVSYVDGLHAELTFSTVFCR